jgi:hypothetical protein
VNDEKDGIRTDRSKSDPTFFFACRLVTLRQSVGILENENSGLKADMVPEQVLAILILVPFKTHGPNPAIPSA